jgi:DNA-binding response OmpR family regulator
MTSAVGRERGAVAKTVWLVEDSREMRDEIAAALSRAGFAVRTFGTGTEALAELAQVRPDLILLDALLPDMDADHFCAEMATERIKTRPCPLMIISTDAEGAGNLLSRYLFVADSIIKPFSTDSLVFRLYGIFHRLAPRSVSGRILVQPSGKPELECSAESRQIKVDGDTVQLAPVEHRLLVMLLSKKGQTLSRAELLESIWSDDAGVSHRSIDVAMVSLRRKLGRVGGSIKTVRGVGYRFE